MQTNLEPDLGELITHVRTTQWYRLGLQLDVADFDLQNIELNEKQNEDGLKAMFQKWLKNCINPSWKDVTTALQAIGERNLGTKLEQRFCK